MGVAYDRLRPETELSIPRLAWLGQTSCNTRSDFLLFRPDPQLIQNIERCSAKISNLVGNSNWTRAKDLSLYEPDFLHFFEALVDHLLTRPTKLPSKVVETNWPVFQMPKDRTFPLAPDHSHTALNWAWLEARLVNCLAASGID